MQSAGHHHHINGIWTGLWCDWRFPVLAGHTELMLKMETSVGPRWQNWHIVEICERADAWLQWWQMWNTNVFAAALHWNMCVDMQNHTQNGTWPIHAAFCIIQNAISFCHPQAVQNGQTVSNLWLRWNLPKMIALYWASWVAYKWESKRHDIGMCHFQCQ